MADNILCAVTTNSCQMHKICGQISKKKKILHFTPHAEPLSALLFG